MSYLHDDLPPLLEGRTIWYGTIADAPATFADRVYIIVPEYLPDTQLGPCRWQSRGSIPLLHIEQGGTMVDIVHDILPQRGNPCLAVLDNRKQWWVLAWWPYDS